MKIPGNFLEKKENAEFFLALVLRNEKVTSVIFEKQGNTIKYVSHDEEFFKNTIEDSESEEFLDTLDKVITQAETSLPPNVETHKTLFGLKDSWIEDNKIKKEYLEKLKKASSELNLEPIGFLAASESIINLVQKEEGAPVTAVLADIGKKYITVSLIKAGRVLETKQSEIHQSASYTVDTLLKHFQTPEVMPSRILLLNSEEEELAQEFIGHQWSKSLPFLHLPQITALPEDATVKAMLLGAATQMNVELLYDSSHMIDNDRPTKITPNEFPESAKVEALEKEEPVVPPGETPKPTLDYVSEDSSMEYFGFVPGADIAKTPAPVSKLETPQIPVSDNFSNADLREQTAQVPEDVKLEEEAKMGTPVNVALVTTKIKEVLPVVLNSFKKIKFNKAFVMGLLAGGNKKMLAIPAVIVVLLVIVLYFYLFTTKAQVTVSFNPKGDENTTSVTFSSSEPTDVKNGVIAAQFVSVDEDGSVTTNATGKKDIGNEAKGSVTVFNNDDKSASFPSGTTITSSNNLKFTLDAAVTVASASGDAFSGTKPGTASVNVTAAAIGQESNLPSGTKFSIGSNSSIAAKNDNAFSGGSKKQVTVVSDEDIAKLLKDLPKELEDKARDEIKGKVDSGKTVLNTFVDETVSDQSLSKKKGDEAKEVTLKGTVTYRAASYNNSDILELAASIFGTGDEISKNDLEMTAKNIVIEKNKDVNADLTIKAKLLPKIDKESLAKDIAGKSLQVAQNRLNSLPQVQNVEIKISPNVPFLPKNLPGNPKSITITITSN